MGQTLRFRKYIVIIITFFEGYCIQIKIVKFYRRKGGTLLKEVSGPMFMTFIVGIADSFECFFIWVKAMMKD